MESKNSLHTAHEDLSPNRANAISKSSDFTIEHILNKAGSKDHISHSSTINRTILPENPYLDAEYLLNAHNHQKQIAPMLNWLQYTRYKPPKIARKLNILTFLNAYELVTRDCKLQFK